MLRRGMIREVKRAFDAARDSVDEGTDNGAQEKRRIGSLKRETVRVLRGVRRAEQPRPPTPHREPTGREREPGKERKGPGIAKAQRRERPAKKGAA